MLPTINVAHKFSAPNVPRWCTFKSGKYERRELLRLLLVNLTHIGSKCGKNRLAYFVPPAGWHAGWVKVLCTDHKFFCRRPILLTVPTEREKYKKETRRKNRTKTWTKKGHIKSKGLRVKRGMRLFGWDESDFMRRAYVEVFVFTNQWLWMGLIFIENVVAIYDPGQI